MSYRSEVQCDACDAHETAPQDGGFPFGWAEINIKPSNRGPSQQGEKRRRLHLCDECMATVFEHLPTKRLRAV